MSELICIGCPMGCMLTVTEGADGLSVEGNSCKIGETYAQEEMLNPTRNVTSSVSVSNGKMLSVKTARPVPKQSVMDCVKALKDISVTAPIYIGDTIMENVAGTGIAVVATRTVE